MGPRTIADLKRLADLKVMAADAALARAHAELAEAERFTRRREEELDTSRGEADRVRRERIRAVLGRPSTIAQVSRVTLAYHITEDDIRARIDDLELAREAETEAQERVRSAQAERARCMLRQQKFEHLAEQLALAAASETEFREELEAEA